eukprot:4681504-Pyramimonas_sp.AAC.1
MLGAGDGVAVDGAGQQRVESSHLGVVGTGGLGADFTAARAPCALAVFPEAPHHSPCLRPSPARSSSSVFAPSSFVLIS